MKRRLADIRADLIRVMSGNCSHGLRHSLVDEFEQAVRADELERLSRAAELLPPGARHV